MELVDEHDTALNPKSYSTVDPEVRAYVYSLVSAVYQRITYYTLNELTYY